MDKNRFKSYALIMISTVILTLASTLPIGLFGVIFTALLASTIGYTVTKHHYYFVGLVCVCMLLIHSLFSQNFISSFTISLPVMLCGISLGIAYNIKLSEFKLLGILTCIYTLYFLLSIKISGVNIQDTFLASLNDYTDALLTVYEGQISQAEIKNFFAQMLSATIKLMPSVMIILCGCVSLLMLYIFKKVLHFTKSDISHFKSFSEWQPGKSFSIVFIIISVINFFTSGSGYYSDALLNVAIVSQFVFYIFGLSFADFLLKRKMMHSFSRRVILIILAIFTFGTSNFIISTIGVIDGCLDLRGKLSKNSQTK